jgi:hypothetical protein
MRRGAPRGFHTPILLAFLIGAAIGTAPGAWGADDPEIEPAEKALGDGPDWAMSAGPDEALFGWSVAGAGDVNCDGYDDIIIGSPGFDHLLPQEGLVIVYHGSPEGLSIGPGNWARFGGQEGAQLGFSVAGAGDVNADGCGDIIVGAPGYQHLNSGEGAAWVFHGSAAGLPEDPDNFDFGNQVDAQFGWTVGSAGDVNRDGYDDVFVGAPFYDNPLVDEGTVWVWHGSASGISNLHDWRAEGDEAYVALGYSVAGAGDVNHDLCDDLLVGAIGFSDGQGGEGAAFVWHGTSSGLNLDITGNPGNADWSRDSNQHGAWFGFSVSSAGDVNADGFSDVIIGTPYFDAGEEDEGAAWLYLGSGAGLGFTSVNRDEGNQAFGWFGHGVAGAGDVNNDGRDDVIVGAPFYFAGEGKVWVWHGSPSGISALADWSFANDLENSQLGYSVASAGDVNGDGHDDVIVGAPGVGGSGMAMVFYGGDPGIFGDGFESGDTVRWSATSP